MMDVVRRRVEHLFFLGLALVLGGYVLLGFWHSYIGAGVVLAPLPSVLVHVHAILFVGWIMLLAVQTGLVGTGHVRLHRRLGAVLAWWAAVMVLVGPITVVMAVRRPDSGLGGDVLAGDLAQTIAFVILVVTGFVRRRSAADHKRLMSLASAAIIGPAIARWPFALVQTGPLWVIPLFYLAPPMVLIVYDLAVLRRVHRATWLGLGLMGLVLVSFIALPAWHGWQLFTSWVQHA